VAVPVGMDDDIDEVRVVERGRRAVERLVGVLPPGGPGVPQIPDDVASIRLKPLPAAVDLVGDFTLTGRVSAKETRAGEPIYLTVRLKGVGYPPPKRLIHLRLPGVDIFEDAPKVSLRYAPDGAHYDATYTYALKADRNFSIPAFALKAFSPTSGELYRLKTKKFGIHVLPVKKTETPVRHETIEEEKTATDGWETLKQTLFYGALFLIGYISGYLWFKVKRMGDET